MLEQWTLLSCKDIVFHSDIDNWSKTTSVLNERIIGKRYLLFLIDSEDGERFGYFINPKIEDRYDQWQKVNKKSFEFNLQSNKRLIEPTKFECKMIQYGYHLEQDSKPMLISLGDIRIYKEEFHQKSCCFQNENNYQYHSLTNALCGKINNSNNDGDHFSIKRIVVIQMGKL